MKKSLLLILMIFNLSLFAFEQSGFLTVDEAFKVDATQDNQKVTVNIELGEQIYLYADKLKFTITKPKELSIGEFLKLPTPKQHDDYMVFQDKNIDIDIPLSLIKEKVGEGAFTLKINYQGCTEKGLCYQPLNKSFDFHTSNAVSKRASWKSEAEPKSETNTATQVVQSEEDQIINTLKSGSMFTILAIFFGFGLLLSLTPCIFPMIPILSSIIVSESGDGKDKMSAKRGLFLSAVYVFSMSVAYAFAGVLAGLFGANIQTAMQNPWVISTFALVFIALAFSMFGYYEIKLPSKLQSKINKTSDKAKGNGGLVGVAIMGFLSALIVGPCVAPALAGALVYIGQTGDALLGGAALFVMSLGMGAPLLAIGAGAGKFMPKPGGWMTLVSQIFGVVMLGIAIWLLSRILPGEIILFLWALFFIASGVYAGAFDSVKENTKQVMKMIKVIAITSVMIGAIMLIGAFSGATDPLKPFAKFGGGAMAISNVQTNSFKKVKTIKELEYEVKNSDKPIMIKFTADWCVICKELEEITFVDPKVAKLMSEFKLLKIDMTKNSDDDKALLKKFDAVGPPTIIFYDKDANELKNFKTIGFKSPEVFSKTLENVLGR